MKQADIITQVQAIEAKLDANLPAQALIVTRLLLKELQKWHAATRQRTIKAGKASGAARKVMPQ